MNAARLGLVAALATLIAFPAVALTAINDSAPNTELRVYQIYNAIYGTSFSSSSGASDLGGVDMLGMDDIQLDPDQVFQLAGDPGGAVFIARYAGQTQRFGYYTNPDGGSLSGSPAGAAAGLDGTDGGGNPFEDDYHHLFDITGPSRQLDLTGSIFAVIDPSDSPIGFYNNTPIGSGTTWYSQVDRNSDGMDHMVAFWALRFNSDTNAWEIDNTTILLAWEDRSRFGDHDYNDLVVEVVIPGGIIPRDPIPEPATAGLLLLGLAGVALRRRFSA